MVVDVHPTSTAIAYREILRQQGCAKHEDYDVMKKKCPSRECYLAMAGPGRMGWRSMGEQKVKLLMRLVMCSVYANRALLVVR